MAKLEVSKLREEKKARKQRVRQLGSDTFETNLVEKKVGGREEEKSEDHKVIDGCAMTNYTWSVGQMRSMGWDRFN